LPHFSVFYDYDFQVWSFNAEPDVFHVPFILFIFPFS
jgi:hypothetical protein